ncbi:AI-2E family transporter [Marivirga sp. S37H4]|uniref:AI-2E family transporter n=1 Tax=Marivirga aurantiaca TaxID=2802615 RepID=A0A935C911_9BACT|nr:AI-2E family transporter [Marivirga aurantiaca]MBK6265795.1 AI-2E family transporter [Marivirga aurantiaca]
MNNKLLKFLLILFLLIGIFYLFFLGMDRAKEILAPIFLAIILSMMLVPVANFLEKKGMSKGWSVFFSDMIFVLFIAGTLWAVGVEVKRVSGQWSSIEERLSTQFDQLESFVETNTGFSIENPFEKSGSQQENGNQESGQQDNQQSNNENTQPGTGQEKKDDSGGMDSSVKNQLGTVVTSIFSSLGNLLLIAVYIFFMLLYREKFRNATLKFIPENQQEEGKEILTKIVKQARQFLIGKVILVLALTIIYSIGFVISGMESPFTIAFLAAVLSLVPYIGPLVGGIIAIAVAYITTGELNAVWIVFATYVLAQFIESYLVEPFLVGNRIKVNPLFTIIAIIIGAAVWGVIGMIVFLPLFSFIKSIADHVPMLHPLAYVIGNEDSGDGEGMESKLAKKVKGWFKRK